MVVTGTNGGAFCKDFGAVILTDVPGPIKVNYTITCQGTYDAFSENYAPDAGGQVRIGDLGELALCYFEELPVIMENQFNTYYYTAVLTANIFADSQVATFTQKFYYSNCRTNITEPYKYLGFLSRHHRRKIRIGQAQFLGFFGRGQQLGIGVSYKSGNSVQWVEFALPKPVGDSYLIYCNIGVDALLSLIQEYGNIDNVSAENVLYYIAYLKYEGQVVDAMQFDVDQTYYSVLSHFVYYNCFGIPDTLYFTGKDTRTSEMEATYATIQRMYRKIDTRYNIFHDVNTGYINETLRDCVEDLVESGKVYLYNDKKLGDMITVTEVNFDESRPRTEPVNVKLKYRLSAECQRSIDRDMSVDYRIFDHTFGVTFE